MNDDTLVAVCCYQGDAHLVSALMPQHQAHGCPIIVFSPSDSVVLIPGVVNHSVGRRAYIGEDSLQRQLRYLEHLLTWPQRYFLINDSDSFCAGAKLPEALREADENVGTVIWSSEVVEPRPHASPYPKLAFQPPYFLHRDAVARMLRVASRVPCHPITPYVDWFMLALSCEAGLAHRSFESLEQPSSRVFKATLTGEDAAWQELDYRMRYKGARFCHPIKTPDQIKLCTNARKFYEAGL